MRVLRARAVAVLTGLVFLASAGPAAAWGAIAVSNKKATRWGYSYDHPTKAAAEARALQECGSGCKVVVTFQRGCGAYAYGFVDKDTEYGLGTGRNRKAAEDMALDDCEFALWWDCEIKVWACNSR